MYLPGRVGSNGLVGESAIRFISSVIRSGHVAYIILPTPSAPFPALFCPGPDFPNEAEGKECMPFHCSLVIDFDF